MNDDTEFTVKQQRFIEEYTRDFNATQAAIRAGYSEKTAYSIGHENLNKEHIAEAIQERLDALSMSADEALKRLTDWGRGDPGPFLRHTEDGRVVVDLSTEEARANLHLIQEISYDSDGRPKVKLYDAKDAVKQIARAHGLFVDRVQHSGEMSLEHLLKEVADEDRDDEA